MSRPAHAGRTSSVQISRCGVPFVPAHPGQRGLTADHELIVGVHYAELLKRITDQAFNEGEHAEEPPRSPASAPCGSGRRGLEL